MTTLKDILNDLIEQTTDELKPEQMSEKEYNDAKIDLLDEYLQIIKDRLIGE